MLYDATSSNYEREGRILLAIRALRKTTLFHIQKQEDKWGTWLCLSSRKHILYV